MKHIYQTTGLTFSYGGHNALGLGDLHIEDKRVTAVVGPNGSGKSTLFDLLAFLREPAAGSILFRGEPTAGQSRARLRRHVGYVQQKPYLMKMSVRDNIGLGLKFRGVPHAARESAVDAVAAELSLAPLLQRDAHKLSGGEIQKVALARALALQPEVVIMDEPFTWLDEGAMREIEEWIAAQRQTRAQTIIFSAHDRKRAQSLSDAVIDLGSL